MYCAYAFGAPITLVVIVFLLNSLELIPAEYASQIGNGTCSVGREDIGDKKTVRFIYIYFPIIITITINIVFYSITAYKIYRVQKDTNFKGGESKRHVKNDVEKMRCV
jgi:G protein-coupled receptor Mth (Methuselah protein)